MALWSSCLGRLGPGKAGMIEGQDGPSIRTTMEKHVCFEQLKKPISSKAYWNQWNLNPTIPKTSTDLLPSFRLFSWPNLVHRVSSGKYSLRVQEFGPFCWWFPENRTKTTHAKQTFSFCTGLSESNAKTSKSTCLPGFLHLFTAWWILKKKILEDFRRFLLGVIKLLGD